MSRRGLRAVGMLAPLMLACPLAAQEALEAQTASPPDRIDILANVEPTGDDLYEDCERDQDAAAITGEIVVCRRRTGDENRLFDKEEAEQRHAERTAFKDDPRPPNFISTCQDQGWPLGCFRMGSVPPPVYMIDFDTLPETPPGSDADRIARGLAPRASRQGSVDAVMVAGDALVQPNADELGLPPLNTSSDLNPSESASPADEPSG